MKNIFKYILTFALGALIFTSCDDLNEPILWEGLEVGFENSAIGVSVDLASTENVTVQIPVMLIGAQQATAINVHVGIDYETSTAVEGTMYTIASQDITIPANSSFGYLDVVVVRTGFVQANEAYDLNFMLTASDVKIGLNFAHATLSIKTAQSYNVNDFLGDYTWVEYDVTSAKYWTTTVTLEHVAGDTVTYQLWPASDDDDTKIKMYFVEADNTIVISGGQVNDADGHILGSYDSLSEDAVGTFVNGGETWAFPSGYGCFNADGSVYFQCNDVVCTRPGKAPAKSGVQSRR